MESETSLDLTGGVITERMIEEEKKLEEQALQKEKELRDEMQKRKEEEKKEEDLCYKRLNLLLDRSSIYAKFMAEKVERDKQKEAKKLQIAERRAKSKTVEQSKLDIAPKSPKKKRHLIEEDVVSENNQNAENELICDVAESEADLPADQPSLLTGGVMHPYQIEGFVWMKTLFENGLNGILADEMGLGKTIQAIAFIAHLIEMGCAGPFFVCGPLSTLPNWLAEFKRFTPLIPAILYHGTQLERKDLRSKIMKRSKFQKFSSFPVVITSYQIAVIDGPFLSKYSWKSVVIDEGHRIKNFECQLVGQLKRFTTMHRLLLTGTPLQNDLRELWSLLNFILPEIFDDLKVFESWFDINQLLENGISNEIIAKEQEKQIVSIIHQILAPFLLRRTKADVQLKLPGKKEIIVHAPMTQLQKDYYTAAINRTIQSVVGDKRGRYFDVEVDINAPRPKRQRSMKLPDAFDLWDDEKDEAEVISNVVPQKPSDDEKVEEAEVISNIVPQKPADAFSDITLNIRNLTMILRKVCNHPYLISFPLDPRTAGHKIDEDLIRSSGKLLVLDQMLPELKKRGHKILLFSQFVSMLYILEDYCIYRNYSYQYLDGSMSLKDRQEEMESFKDVEDSFIFLISTKAGGLGLNLATADTVIIYDSDWNPQGDIQAQDRAHRIGQTRPVVVYRLIIPNTTDERILNRATAKRQLEKVILKKGRFKSAAAATNQGGSLTIEELQEMLQSVDVSGFVKTNDNNVLSPEELEKILDRSEMSDLH